RRGRSAGAARPAQSRRGPRRHRDRRAPSGRRPPGRTGRDPVRARLGCRGTPHGDDGCEPAHRRPAGRALGCRAPGGPLGRAGRAHRARSRPDARRANRGAAAASAAPRRPATMSWRPPVPASVLDAARAIGLVDASGEIDAQWFQDPLTRVKATLSDPAQREAFRRFLGAVAPPAKTVDGVDWHPLAGDQIFLTLAPTADGIDVGLAAEVGGAAQLRATLLVAHVTATDVSLPPAPFTI